MAGHSDPFSIVMILTVGFAFASILGYLSQRAKISPILGYLLAGYMIGPYSPGFVADVEVSEQLAEIGVVLMMLGVGLHFKWHDLMNVKRIAIPGALGQTFVAATVGVLLVHFIGWPLEAGIVVGLAIGVASTVVLIRVLSDNHILNTPQGHIAVGWLIVEDILTVIVLLLLPTLASITHGGNITLLGVLSEVGFVLAKFAVLILIMFTIGTRFVKFALVHIARTRSHELFTLTVLALTFVIATGSAFLFGTSIALGAFIAGMAIGQTDVKHQASANALPLKDAFVVIFFLSIGMLFNPDAIANHFLPFLGILGIILLIKPLTAFLIVYGMRYPLATALTVSIALAQIGEFSFILAEQALKLRLLPDDGYDIIVACALISISLNPLFFKLIPSLVSFLERKVPKLSSPQKAQKDLSNILQEAIVIGFGPVGQTVASTLEKNGFKPIVVDRNIDTIAKLHETDREAIFGDASFQDILESAHIETATILAVTQPDIAVTTSIINLARRINPRIKILARVRYLNEQQQLDKLGVNFICCDEDETMKAFHNALSRITGRVIVE